MHCLACIPAHGPCLARVDAAFGPRRANDDRHHADSPRLNAGGTAFALTSEDSPGPPSLNEMRLEGRRERDGMVEGVATRDLGDSGTAALLRSRSITGCWLILATVGIFMVADIGIAPDRFVLAYALKITHATLLLSLVTLLRTTRSETATRWIALIAVNGTYLLMGAGDLVKGHLATAPLLCVTTNMSAAALLPWGIRPQLATFAFTGIGNVLLLQQTGLGLAALVDPASSVIVAQAVAVYVAYELDRFRLERTHVENHLAMRARTEAMRADVRLALSERPTRTGQLAACARAVATHLDASLVWIWTEHDGAWRLEAAAGPDVEPHQLGHAPGPATARALAAAATARDAFFTDDIDDHRAPIIPPALRGTIRAAFAALPLRSADRTLGILHVRTPTALAPVAREALVGVAGALTSGLARLEAEEARAKLMTALERANRIKSEFVSTMSHELRTPLNVIMGYTDMLSDPDYSDPAFALGRIRHANHELLELIEATLDLNRLESGRDEPHVQDVFLAELWDELAAEFHPTVSGAEVSIDWDVDRDVVLRTDRRKLKIIVKNLVGNAIKFTPQGSVSVRARCIEGACTIDVRDTGIGIPPDALPTIFEMFQQADSSDRRSYGGVGLGLHIVRRLCDQLGATVDVESHIGSGSCFTIRVPVRGPAVYAA